MNFSLALGLKEVHVVDDFVASDVCINFDDLIILLVQVDSEVGLTLPHSEDVERFVRLVKTVVSQVEVIFLATTD